MNWKSFDSARREVGPIELDLIESYAQNKISRRNFVKRGTIIGLSAPFMGAIIAACGGSDGEATGADGTTVTTASGDGGAAPSAGGNLIVAVQQGDASTGLDPVNMNDLGTYCTVAQSFEYLVGLGPDGNIGDTGLATSWSPNAAGDEWTFELRPGVKWHSGGDFTSADVAATMDRLALQGNAGLADVIGEGSVDASDPLVAKVTLIEANGNFPVLVSIFNAQSLITPADYTDGTTLSERPDGTGPWKLTSFDPTTFTTRYEKNTEWWGGDIPMDTTELRGFADIGTQVTAMASREIDVIQQFSVIGGEGLLGDASFTVLEPPSVAHRQVWFNTQGTNEFVDKNVRKALAFTMDREQMVSTLFDGRAQIGNDHPILSTLPFFDETATPQRSIDIDQAKQYLADAGVDSVNGTIECGDIQEVPQLAAIIQQNAAQAGINVQVNAQSNSTFYEDQWCPGLYDETTKSDTKPCGPSGNFGIIDWGHRPIPDVFLGSALGTNGVWNASNYANPEFDQLLSDYRTATDVAGQKTAIGAMQKILHEDTPACYPYFYNYLSGHANNVSGVEVTALGHVLVGKASKA